MSVLYGPLAQRVFVAHLLHSRVSEATEMAVQVYVREFQTAVSHA